MIQEIFFRTQTPFGEPMQARDLDFLRLNMRRFMGAQGLDASEYEGWFNPPVVEVRNSYDKRRLIASVTGGESFALWGGEVRL